MYKKDKLLTVPLTTREHKKIKQFANKINIPMSELVRQAMCKVLAGEIVITKTHATVNLITE